MQKQIVLLALAVLCLGYGRAHPLEMKITGRFISALRDEIRGSDYSNESAVPDAIIEERNIMTYPGGDMDDLSGERISCINLGNDGCVNGYIVGSGGDGGYLGGEGNPGK